MEMLWRFLMMLLLLFLGFIGYFVVSEESAMPPDTAQPTAVPAGPTASPNATLMPIVVETVSVNILESYPMQAVLDVSGYIPDGCEFPLSVSQRREGDTVYVDILRAVDPAAACPMMIVGYQESIQVEGTFEAGETIIFNVNGVEVQAQF